MNWLGLIKTLAPIVLAATPLAPIAPFISLGIGEAEQLAGASGPEKLAHAVNIAQTGIAAVNAQAGKDLIDPALSADAISKGISTVVDVTNIVHKAQQ